MATKKQEDIQTRRAEQYKNTFIGDNGQAVLAHLKSQWCDRPLLDHDPLIMAANCALHDAYLKINDLVEIGKGTKEFKKPLVILKKPNPRYDVDEIIPPEET